MDYVSDPVPMGPEVEPEDPPDLSGEMPAEMPAEVAEMEEAPGIPEMPPEMPQKPARAPRIRKVRVVPAREASPPPMSDHAFWTERLRAHRATDRAAKDERYGNLRIV